MRLDTQSNSCFQIWPVADLGGSWGGIAPPPPCNLKEYRRVNVVI